MAASVRIEDEAFADERYGDLAVLAGLADADHARGKMARLWRQCTIEQTHFLSRETVTRILGARGVDALVGARLGVETDRGIRIRGTRGRIEWLKKLRSNGKFGAKGGRPRKNPQGFPEKPMRVSENAKSETPPAPAPAPAPALALRERERPLEIAEPPVPRAEYDPLSPVDRGALGREIYNRVNRAHTVVGAELGLSVRPPLPELSPSARPRAWRDLLERITEEGTDAPAVCHRVVESLIADARGRRDLTFLGAKGFTEGGWITARERVPRWRRAGPPRSETDDEPPLGDFQPLTTEPQASTA